MVQSQLATMELTECLTDSPYFRETLHSYEKELESTNSSIKSLIKIIKDLLSAARRLSECQRAFSSALDTFHFATIGGTQTDDEAVICSSLKEFSRLVNTIEAERSRMLDNECSQFVLALENFRATHIASAKEGRKKFEKQTQKFCTSMERHLNMSTKKHEDHAMKEADASLEMEQRCFVQTSMNYVCKLQEIEQRKKFDFVETLLTFVYGWLTFYHHGYEVAQDSKPFMNDLQSRLQKTREEFDETRTKVESLKNKTLEERQTKSPMYSRQGYLYLMEKKAFGTTWTKHYCMYDKKEKFLSLVPYNQLNGKQSDPVVLRLRTCVRRMSETIDRRFCFDVTAQDRDGQVYTLQATCAEDRRLWMDAMDGKEPTYCKPGLDQPTEHTALDDAGFYFVNKCVAQLEGRGLEEQGLYRVVGVASKVTRLVQLGRAKAKFDKQCLDSPVEWESKTITSAIKTYFRNLPEPLMTYRLHSDFILAAKNDNKDVRVAEVHRLVNQLPKVNYRMLKTLLQHLTNVSAKADRNLMSVSNLGVCFGPTLLRPEEETMAAIIDIKFCNIVVEILIRYFYKIFGGGGFAAGDLSPLVADSADSGAAVVSAPLPLMNGCGGASSTGGVAPDKSAIISATAQPIQIMPYDSEPPLAKPLRPGSVGSTSLAAAAAAQRRAYPPMSAPITSSSHLPPPYAHPPPPPHTLQHSSPPSSADSSLTQLPHRIQHPLHVFNPAVMNDRDRVEGCLVGGGGSANISNNSMSGSGLSGSSSESLSSPRSSPRGDPPPQKGPSVSGISTGSGSVACQPPSPYSTKGKLGIHYPPSYRSQPDLRVRTLYACVGENTSELSFEPNQIITNVRPSREPGWLEGTLNGHFGLVPDNYVEYLP